MTLEEMKSAISDVCYQTKTCEVCPLKDTDEDWCDEYEHRENGEELLKKHYEILFGKEETKTALTAEQKIEILRQMSADAFEWATGMEVCDGYWRGVAYMMSSVLEMGNETD